MDVKSVNAGFLMKNHFPLKMAGGSALSGGYGILYQNMINGQNLVRKSAQLVNDIENIRDAPKSISANASTMPQPVTSLQSLIDKIKEQLSQKDQSFTLLNVVKAQLMLAQNTIDDESVDAKA